MTKSELRAEVRRRLAEINAPVFWTDADIDDAIDLGYAEISDETEWLEEWVDIELLRQRPYYDLRRVVGDDLLSVGPAFDRQTNRWLLPSTTRQLDAGDWRWERVTGEPQRIFVRGLWWLGYYPRIQSDVGTIKQYYTRLPDPLVLDADLGRDDEPGFPETWHLALADFAMSDLLAQDGENELAEVYWNDYSVNETALKQFVYTRNQTQLLRGFQGAATPSISR